MLLLVGLGNPGPNNNNNRHNIGFKIIDAINQEFSLSKQKPKFKGLLTTGNIENKKVYAIKPLTFMNNSGVCIKELIEYFKINAKDVIVFHDDMDIDLGKVKAKFGGSSAGHNGIESIDKSIGKDYSRVRVGIGRPQSKNQVNNHVLEDFSENEEERIKDIILEQGVSENKILCLSFSKAAQSTMIDRFKDDVDLKGNFEKIIKNREKNKLDPLSKDEQEKMQKCIRNISIGENSIRTIHSLGRKISGSKNVIEDDELKKFHDGILETDYPIISMKHPVGTGFPDFKQRLNDAVSAWKKERAMLDKLSKYIDDLKSQKPEKIDKENKKHTIWKTDRR